MNTAEVAPAFLLGVMHPVQRHMVGREVSSRIRHAWFKLELCLCCSRILGHVAGSLDPLQLSNGNRSLSCLRYSL